jgi:hypothetical protein
MMSAAATEAPELELTEFEVIDAQKVSGVKSAANGFPHLIMKGVAKDAAAGVAADTHRGHAGAEQPATQVAPPSHSPENTGRPDDDSGTAEPGHQPWTGRHMHEHPAGNGEDPNGDGLHMHMHDHHGDNDHGTHNHAGADVAGSGTRSPFDDISDVAQSLAAAKKAVVDGKIDQAPDIKLADQMMHLLAQAIENEAQEIAAGKFGETCDVALLSDAADLLSCWRSHEMEPVAQSAWVYDAAGLVKDSRTFSTAERKKYATGGHALPDGSYPIPDADALRRAAILARSKHGNWQAARKLIARRARELGVTNPLDDDDTDASASKSVATEVTTVDTVTQEDAVTKALATQKAEIDSLRAELAKVLALPRQGGPVSGVPMQPTRPAHDDTAAKAQLMRAKAEAATDPADRASYRQLARELEEKATTTTA